MLHQCLVNRNLSHYLTVVSLDEHYYHQLAGYSTHGGGDVGQVYSSGSPRIRQSKLETLSALLTVGSSTNTESKSGVSVSPSALSLGSLLCTATKTSVLPVPTCTMVDPSKVELPPIDASLFGTFRTICPLNDTTSCQFLCNVPQAVTNYVSSFVPSGLGYKSCQGIINSPDPLYPGFFHSYFLPFSQVSLFLGTESCNPCLPPCKNQTTSTRLAVSSPSYITSSGSSVVPHNPSQPSCTNTATTPCSSPPTAQDGCSYFYGTGDLLLCQACPIDHELQRRCPWLCSIPDIGSSFCSLSTDTGTTTSNGNEQCIRCLPRCN